MRPTADRPVRKSSARSASARFVCVLACALAACAAACARAGLQARPDVTPQLAQFAVQTATAEAVARDPAAGSPLTPREQIDHVLSRATFGPRPGDRERVEKLGISTFLEEQLHPERIDDAAVAKQLEGLHVLRRSSAELTEELIGYRKAQKKQREDEERQGREMPTREMPMKDPPLRKAMGKAGRGPGFDDTIELSEAKLLRAIASERQLYEVMADFWFNHFNVFAGKNEEAALLPEYEREAIRPNALGGFPELLTATAHSPAMLIYLDNWISTAPEGKGSAPRRRVTGRDGRPMAPRAARKKRKAAGLNENYARELLELHTLGVDGGYTQRDVTEVARCFTGWTVAEPQKDPRFVFRPALHDDGPKDVLGLHLEPGGGERDGERVLDLLSHHPSTAHFIASKLVRRFVSDDPPEALVERVAAVYLRTQGDIRGMLREIFESPELWSRRALKAKMRSPLELVAASIRSLSAQVDEPWQLARAVARIGQPLYAAQPPTGYPDTQSGWASSGALLARIDFGLQLAAGQLDGVRVDLATLSSGAPGPDEVLARAAMKLGAGEMSETTRLYVLGQLREINPGQAQRKPELVAQRAVGLLLGAPELQRR
jgi:uncharacterized protein (DUF1800 family)